MLLLLILIIKWLSIRVLKSILHLNIRTVILIIVGIVIVGIAIIDIVIIVIVGNIAIVIVNNPILELLRLLEARLEALSLLGLETLSRE